MNRSGKFVIWLWKNISVMASLLTTMVVFAGFWWLTVYRFQSAGLTSRMALYAEILQVGGASIQDAKSKVDELNARFGYQCHFGSEDAVVQAVHQYSVAKKAASIIGVNGTLDTLKKLLPLWAPRNEVPIVSSKMGIKIAQAQAELSQPFGENYKKKAEIEQFYRFGPLLSKDRFELVGINPDKVETPTEKLSSSSFAFLCCSPVFSSFSNIWSHYGEIHQAHVLKPWDLFRFYDSRRADLNESIPRAMGIIMIATGLFLGFRLIDYSKSLSRPTLIPRSREDAAWIPLWETSNSDLPFILRHPRLAYYMLAGCVGTMYIEFFLNEPLTRVEWIVNAPVMLLVGILVPTLWTVLWEIGGPKLRLNPALNQYSNSTRQVVLRPFLVGTVSLIFLMSWLLFDSVTVLFGNTPQRAILHVVVGIVSLSLLWRVWRRVNSQLKDIPEADSGGPIPKSESWSGWGENSTRALLLALLPASLILDILLK